MGQKVHPYGFRVGINKPWLSRWYGGKDYAKILHEDLDLRKFLKKQLDQSGVSLIEIERIANKVKLEIHTARPGIVIGKKGAEIERLRKVIAEKTGREVLVNVREIKRPELDAQLVAENIAAQIKRRVSFRRAMKRAVTAAMKLGAEGIRVGCGGRLGGAEIARSEWYREGRVPLHTLRADVDYGFAEGFTTYGTVGVKVTIFKGELLSDAEGPRLARSR
ncbi:MAG: 30S ribosomal protein S3 [Desulfuromonadales bacterium]|nr:30S ribosomal protein S3 [Desulfuromonadales bacterium]